MLALALSLSALASTGCFIDARGMGPVARAALWTAAIIGTAIVIDAHDDHYHHESCGHYRRWHEDRWVYYYEEHWEYYDEPSSRWYVYIER